MTARPETRRCSRPKTFLVHQESKSLLRFIVCGSADHGQVDADWPAALRGPGSYSSTSSTHSIATFPPPWHAGRRARFRPRPRWGWRRKREQKITIDVAYRFFSTARRKFHRCRRARARAIHPQHGDRCFRHSRCGAAAGERRHRPDAPDQATTRSSCRPLASGTSWFAINKMGPGRLVAVQVSRSSRPSFRAFAKNLDVDDIVFIPVAARSGDNIIARPAAHDLVSRTDPARTSRKGGSLHLGRDPPLSGCPVQCVIRPDPNFSGLLRG